jgi:hypothetical protein
MVLLLVDGGATGLGVDGETRCREAEAMVDEDADADADGGSIDGSADEDSETAVDDVEFLEFLKDAEGVVEGRDWEEERVERRRWGVRETCSPMAICSMVGRAVEGDGSRKRVEDVEARSSGVEYMSIVCDAERTWRLAGRFTGTRRRDGRGGAGSSAMAAREGCWPSFMARDI